MEGIQVSTQSAGSHNQISVIKVGGYIDTTTSAEVERSLNGLLKQGRYQIIIDLGNVDYISSAGWGIFISEIKRIRENNGDLKLVQMIPDVYEIFELLEFHHILDVYDSVQEAINKFEEAQYVEMVAAPRPAAAREAAPKPPVQESSASQPVVKQPAPPPREEPQSAPQPRLPNLPRTPVTETAPGEGRRGTTMIDLVSMSLDDKVRHIIKRNPDWGAYKINKKLNSADYGFTRVGWFGVRSLLNKLNLNSRKKRREFAASK